MLFVKGAYAFAYLCPLNSQQFDLIIGEKMLSGKSGRGGFVTSPGLANQCCAQTTFCGWPELVSPEMDLKII